MKVGNMEGDDSKMVINLINRENIKDELFLGIIEIFNNASEKLFPEARVNVHYLTGYDSIEGPDGSRGFGCFYAPENSDSDSDIYIHGDIPGVVEDPAILVETFAHEFYRFSQYCRGVEYSEEIAEDFACKVSRAPEIQEMIKIINFKKQLEKEKK